MQHVVKAVDQLQNASKVKERKEALRSIQSVIEPRQALQAIDSASLQQLNSVLKRKGVTWSDIVSILIETYDQLRTTKGQSTRRDVVDVLKNVIRIADTRGPRLFLVLRKLYDHIGNILQLPSSGGHQAEETWHQIGGDALNILISLCRTPGYCFTFRRSTYHNFLKIFTARLNSIDSHLISDSHLIARALETLITCYPFDYTPFSVTLYPFFLETLGQISPPQPTVAQVLWNTFTHLILSSGVNDLQRTRDCVKTLHRSWLNKQWHAQSTSPNKLSCACIDHILLLVNCKNHKNVQNKQKKNFYFQSVSSVFGLEDLFSSVHSELTIPPSQKLRARSLTAFDYNAFSFIDLAAEVFVHMICKNNDNKVQEANLLSSTAHLSPLVGSKRHLPKQSPQSSKSTPAKRRRISEFDTVDSNEMNSDYVWSLLVEQVSVDQESSSVTSWLQTLALVSEKIQIPSSVLCDLVLNLTSFVHGKTHRESVEVWALHCLILLARQTPVLLYRKLHSDLECPAPDRDIVQQLCDAWQHIWRVLVPKLAYARDHLLRKCILILGELLLREVIDPVNTISTPRLQEDLWLTPAFSDPEICTDAAIDFVLLVLSKVDLLEDSTSCKTPSIQGEEADDKKSSLHERLLSWILRAVVLPPVIIHPTKVGGEASCDSLLLSDHHVYQCHPPYHWHSTGQAIPGCPPDPMCYHSEELLFPISSRVCPSHAASLIRELVFPSSFSFSLWANNCLFFSTNIVEGDPCACSALSEQQRWTEERLSDIERARCLKLNAEATHFGSFQLSSPKSTDVHSVYTDPRFDKSPKSCVHSHVNTSLQSHLSELLLTSIQKVATRLLGEAKIVASAEKRKTVGVDKIRLAHCLSILARFSTTILGILLDYPHTLPKKPEASTVPSTTHTTIEHYDAALTSVLNRVLSFIAEHTHEICSSTDQKITCATLCAIQRMIKAATFVATPHTAHLCCHNPLSLLVASLSRFVNDQVHRETQKVSSKQASPLEQPLQDSLDLNDEMDIITYENPDSNHRVASTCCLQLCCAIVGTLASCELCSLLCDEEETESQENSYPMDSKVSSIKGNLMNTGDRTRNQSATWRLKDTLSSLIRTVLVPDLSPALVFEVVHSILSFGEGPCLIPSGESSTVSTRCATVLRRIQCVQMKIEISCDSIIRTHTIVAVTRIANLLYQKGAVVNSLDERIQLVTLIIDHFKTLYEKKNLNWITRLSLAECLCSVLQIEQLGDTFATLFLSLLQDPDMRVRRAMAQHATIIFKLFDNHSILFADISKYLPTFSPRSVQHKEENIIWGLLTLGEIGCASSTIERRILENLCAWATKENYINVVTSILHNMATRLGYGAKNSEAGSPPVQALLELHLGALLAAWISQGSNMRSFPYSLMSCDNYSTFLKRYAHVMLPRLFLAQDAKSIQEVATLMNVTHVSLVREHFPGIFANTFPLYYIKGKDQLAVALCQKLIPLYLSQKDVNSLIPITFDEIVLSLLQTLSFDKDSDSLCLEDEEPVTYPPFPPEAIRAVLLHLASGWKVELPELLFKSRKVDRVQRIMLHLTTSICTARRPHERRHGIRVFHFFCVQLGNRLAMPPVFRDALYTMLRVVSDRDVRWLACHTLRDFCERVIPINNGEGGRVIGDHINAIINALVSYAREGENSPSMAFIRWIISQAKPPGNCQQSYNQAASLLTKAFKNIEPPLPDALCIWLEPESRELLKKVGNCTLLQVISRYIDSDKNKTESLELHNALLAHLQGVINISRDHLSQLLMDENNQPLFFDLMWRLVQDCKSSSEVVRLHATECLGEIGLCGCCDLSGFVQVSNGFIDGFNSDYKVQMLLRLNMYLIDSDVDVVHASSTALKPMLATDSGKEAFSNLTADVQIYLNPFCVLAQKPSSQRDLPKNSDFLDPKLWNPGKGLFSSWICKLAYAIATGGSVKDEFLRLSADVILHKADFAAFVFPHMCLDMLVHDTAKVKKPLVRQLSELIRSHILCDTNENMESIQLALDTLTFLRLHFSSEGNRSSHKLGKQRTQRFWDGPLWQGLSLLDIARAAVRCNAYYTALLYVELWCEQLLDSTSLGLCVPTSQDLKQKTGEDLLHQCNELLLDILASISEPDSIYGVTQQRGMGASSLGIKAQLLTYQHEGQWEKAAGIHDMILSNMHLSPITELVPHYVGLLDSLQKLGNEHLLECYLQGCAVTAPHQFSALSDVQFECAWRNQRWSLPSSITQLITKAKTDTIFTSFNREMYGLFRALDNGDVETFQNSLKRARICIVDEMARTSTESTTAIHYSIFLGKLQMVSDVASLWSLRWSRELTLRTPDDNELSKLANHRKSTSTWRSNGIQFSVIEPILTSQRIGWNVIGRQDRSHSVLLEMARLARKANRFALAEAALYKFLHTITNNPLLTARVHFQMAKIHWDQKQAGKAISIAQEVLRLLESSSSAADESTTLTGRVLCTTATWLAYTRSERSSVIDELLQKSIVLHKATGKSGEPQLCKSFFALGHYADNLYQGLITKMKSREWEASQELRRHKERQLAKYKQLLNDQERFTSTRDFQDFERYVNKLQKECEVDKMEEKRIQQDMDLVLKNAIVNYISCLQYGDKFDVQVVFRLCSLWFNNSASTTVNTILRIHIPHLQSHKFLPLVHQISSRLSSNTEAVEFQQVLFLLVERMASSHPHHILWQIFALAHGSLSEEQDQGKKRKIGPSIQGEDKVRAAQEMIVKLSTSPNLAPIINEMRRLIEQYMELADMDVSQYKRETRPLPLPSSFKKLHDMKHVAVPTKSLPVQSSAIYDQIIFIHRFEDTYSLVGGLNLPKVINCLGSDGQKYKQLVKGRDDSRQDAVMEQVFEMVNILLRDKNNPSTRQRALTIRTYKVIPLSPTSGILEWVTNTIPIGEYLIGSVRDQLKCAHVRYRPQDKLSLDCRKELTSAKNKASAFSHICNSFKPVFHHFFLEHFHTPAEWFARRLTYTRSVASNSIVGYIVGLGDRHSQNILIDKATAELVHIDLGVAFDQGKMLRTPEIIPFRLTRDLVDGMGVSGVEGVFRRCSEETMRVLRNRHESLLTILEVFIHDPLYKWALDPLAALHLQSDPDELHDVNQSSALSGESVSVSTGNKDAERALLRLTEKLQGYEAGEAMSVEGVVNHLINEARSPDNLAKMFPGWAPWV